MLTISLSLSTLKRFIMARITATLSTRQDPRGKSEILLRFVGGRDNIYRLHSKLYVSPSRWKEGAVVIPRLATQEQRELKELQARLDALTEHLVTEFQGAPPDAVSREWMQDAVERFHHPGKRADQSIVTLIEDFIAAKQVSPGRKKRYEVALRALERFERYRGRTLAAEDVDARTLGAFRTFLEEEHDIAGRREYRSLYRKMDRLPEERGRNVIIEYMKILRAFFRWLNVQGITDNDPFKKFEIGTAAYGTPYYLSIEERERIARTNLSRHPALAAQRDIFVFQCLVGCRVGDLVSFRKEDVQDGVLTYMPRKTIGERPAVVRVPLSRTAREIVERYADLPGEKLLPTISTQKYNDAIKRICLAARIRRPVAVLDPLTREEVKRPLNEIASSHLARRTFIGNLYKQVSDPALIGAMSGHVEGSKAFARYRSIDDEMKAEVVKMLDR